MAVDEVTHGEYAGRKSIGPKWTPNRHQSLKVDQRKISQRRRMRGRRKEHLQKSWRMRILQCYRSDQSFKNRNWKFLGNETNKAFGFQGTRKA